MRHILCWLSLTLSAASWCSLKAQDVDSLSLPANDALLTLEDSLSIFRLIDSLITMDRLDGSQLVLRLGYNSNVLSAGRTLGIEQFGLAPGVSYYHKSGAFADVTTFWSKDFEPPFYLTTASVGYMYAFSKKFSAIASYDHYFYHSNDDDAYIPYTNSFTISPYYELKPFSFRLDYSYYFGDTYANRITPGISMSFRKKKVLGLDRISITPSAFMLLGDELLNEVEYKKPGSVREALENIRTYGMRFSLVVTNRRVFGVMNYAFSVPLTISYKNWMLNLTYTYSIPKALDDEPLTLSESGFVSSSLIYYLSLRSNKY